MLLLTRLLTYKNIFYSPKAHKSFEAQKADFIRRNNRDTHYDYRCHEDIPHQSKFVLVFNEEHGKQPWYSKCWILVCLDLLMIGWIMRLKLNANTKIVKYKLEKYIHH